MTDNLLEPDNREPLGDGGTWLLDLVSVVDHFQRGYRPSFTVWDAIDEAIRQHTGLDTAGPEADATIRDDPLGASIHHLLDHTVTRAPIALQQAIRHWIVDMAQRHNNANWWPHPQPRRAFPPPLLCFESPDREDWYPQRHTGRADGA